MESKGLTYHQKHSPQLQKHQYIKQQAYQMPRLVVSQLKNKNFKVKKSQSYHTDGSQAQSNIRIDQTIRLAAKGHRDSYNLELSKQGSDLVHDYINQQRTKKKGSFFLCC